MSDVGKMVRELKGHAADMAEDIDDIAVHVASLKEWALGVGAADPKLRILILDVEEAIRAARNEANTVEKLYWGTDVESFIDDAEAAADRIEQLEEDAEKLDREKKNLGRQVEEMRRALSESKSQNQDLQGQIAALRTQYAHLTSSQVVD